MVQRANELRYFLIFGILSSLSMLPTKQLYLDLTLKSHIAQLIPCLILTITYYIYKNLMKYQSRLNHIVHTKPDFEFQLVTKDTMPSTYLEPNLILTTKVNKSRSTVKNLSPAITTTTTTEKIQMKQIESEPVCAEWIVVTEKKKNARTVVKEKKPKTKPKKINNNKQNKVKNNIKAIKPKAIIQTTPVSSGQPWSNVVKCRQEEEELIIQDDLPSLSDNESTTGSIESPCLSYKDLSHAPVVEEKYYSPFSTGFDFGVLPSLRSKHDKSMDRYLSATRPQTYYTQHNPHKTSILNLLNQSDQVETTITPTSFKYFDDMMMSTSLYHTTDDTNNISLMNSNKRVWDAIHYIR